MNRSLATGRRGANVMAVAVAIAAASGGCGFIFSEGAPVGYEKRAYFDCGESIAPPAVDIAGAALFALSATGASQDAHLADRSTVAATYAGFAALYMASAAYGFYAVHDCSAAKQARAAMQMQAHALPPPYGVPPYGEPPPLWPPPPAAPPPPAPPPPAPSVTVPSPAPP
jgi:hypothetical protein